MSQQLSVILIVRNEATQIRACLDSVAWADEIIVLDSGSQDATPAICRDYTPLVFETDWPGFGPQKQRALEHASHDWVLSIDADERVPLELRAEILAAINTGRHSAWRIPRLSSYCGRYLRHGDWRNDYVVRLFRRERARFSSDLVHERLIVADDNIGTLRTPLRHESFRTLEQVLDKLNHYSSAGAQARHARGQRGGLRRALGHALWTFLRGYIFRLGFLDGREGFMLAVSNAEGVYYRYLKLAYLREESEEKRER